MNEMTVYWIWLQLCLGSGAKVDEGIAYFGNPKAVFDAKHEQLVYSGAFTPAQIGKLSDKSLAKAEKVITECEDIGCGIITPDNAKYPEALMCMPNYPLVLYTLGNIECMKDKMTISIVGARRASDEGVRMAGSLAASLCRAGVIVVSGGALGIDSAAHLGVLSEGGSTIAVIACGFNANYRDGINIIRDDIMEKGVVISEYPPSAGVKAINFPIRNRIIAALGMGTVVVEAAAKSGSLITANLAAEYGREVFAVPGNAASFIHLGTVGLIRDGAIPVFSSLDILGQFSAVHTDLVKWDKVESDLLNEEGQKIDYSIIKYGADKVVVTKNKNAGVSKKELEEIPPASDSDSDKEELPAWLGETEMAVYEAIAGGCADADSVFEKTGVSMPEILTALTMLEVSGIIKSQGGNIYKKK